MSAGHQYEHERKGLIGFQGFSSTWFVGLKGGSLGGLSLPIRSFFKLCSVAMEPGARIPRDVAIFLGVLFGLGFWGLYTGLMAMTLWITALKGRDKLYSPVIYAIVAIYVLNAISTAAIIGECYNQFISVYANHGDAQQVGIWITIQDIAMALSETIGDAVVGWRLYIIWDRKKSVLYTLCCLGVVSTFYAVAVIVYDILMGIHGPIPQYLNVYNIVAVTGYASTVCFNIVVTGLIVWLLRRAEKPFENNPEAPSYGVYTKISIVLVQSGALYSVFLGLYLVLYYIDSAVSILFAPLLPKIVGIAPTLIVLQRSLGYLHPNDQGGSKGPATRMEFAHPAEPSGVSTGFAFAARSADSEKEGISR